MNNKHFRIIQLNAGRQKETQWGLINDDRTSLADIVLIQEPYIFENGDGNPSLPTHPEWTTYLPIVKSQASRIQHSYRSLIWTHKRISATQIPVESSEITEVLMEVANYLVIITSIYVPYGSNINETEQLLRSRLGLVNLALCYSEQLKKTKVELLMGGDFNWYDQFWGGNRIAKSPRQGDGARLVDWMMEKDLQLLLTRGTPTYESYDGVNASTIDLLFASKNLTNLLIRCGILITDHGSDHQAIEILFEVCIDKSPATPGRRLWEKENWNEIQRRLIECMPPLQACKTNYDLEKYSSKLLESIKQCLEDILRAALSPYAKRWWTPLLTELRKELNRWFNKWTTSKRRGEAYLPYLANVRQSKKLYFREMKLQKRRH